MHGSVPREENGWCVMRDGSAAYLQRFPNFCITNAFSSFQISLRGVSKTQTSKTQTADLENADLANKDL